MSAKGASFHFGSTRSHIFFWCRCVLCSAIVFVFILDGPSRGGMTLLSQPRHWQAHLVWHYGTLWSQGHDFVSGRQNSWLPGKDTAAQGSLSFVVRHRRMEEQLKRRVCGRGLRAEDGKWQTDEWSGVKQDRMTAGIGCQSMTARERQACQTAVISSWLSSRAAGR